MQPRAEDMQLRPASERLGHFRIAPLVDSADVGIVHDYKGLVPRNGCYELLLALLMRIT